MIWHSFRNYWFDLLCLNFGSGLQFEILEIFLICSFAFEFHWFVLSHGDQRFSLAYLLQHLIMLSQLSLLLFCEVLLVVRWSLERKGVEGVLRMLLMENIIVTILPVREAFLIERLTHYWFWVIVRCSDLLLFWLQFEWFVGTSIRCIHVHFMRIDYFCFFFKVESICFFDHNSFL